MPLSPKGLGDNQIYADLDKALTESYVTAWNNYWADLGARITDAIRAKQYFTASELIETLDISSVVEKQRTYAATILQTALLLGVKNITEDVENSSVFKNPPTQLVSNALDQIDTILTRNATLHLKQLAHTELEKTKNELEKTGEPKVLVVKQDSSRVTIDEKVRVKVSVGGKTFFALGPSLLLNRMRSLGFLMEAASRGVTTYRIQAVIDDRTSEICLNLNGRVFHVEVGLNNLVTILTGDPDAAKALSPWPNSEQTRSVPDLSSETLETEGLGLPPYHPFCRTIIVVESANIDIPFAALSGIPDHTDNLGGSIAGVAGVTTTAITPQQTEAQSLSALAAFLLGVFAGVETEDQIRGDFDLPDHLIFEDDN